MPKVTSPVSGAFTSAEQTFDRVADQARTLTLTPPKRITASDGAGFLGGLLLLYVLALNYLRYGKDGVKGWISAKFVNRPMTLPDDGDADGKDKKKLTGKAGGGLGAPFGLDTEAMTSRPRVPEQP